MTQVRAAIWDLGGVLLRTEERGPRAGLAERLGMTYEELDRLVFQGETGLRAARGEIRAEQHWQAVCAGLNLGEEAIPDVQRAFWGGDRLDTALVDYIRSLRPRLRTALLSNAWSDLRQALQSQWHIADAFDALVISAEVGIMKPDPRIYRLALESLGVAPEEAVFIDDFIENIHGARNVGLHAVHFRSRDQVIAELDTLLQA